LLRTRGVILLNTTKTVIFSNSFAPMAVPVVTAAMSD